MVATASRGVAPEVHVSGADRERLLDVARQSVMAAVAGAPLAALRIAGRAADEWVGEVPRAAAFVTLRKGDDLRGCVGTLDATRSVVESVALAAVSSALRDPRFRPIREAELAGLDVEVSVLGPMVVLAEPLAMRIGIDGIVVERGWARGLLLPDVATAFGLDELGMLEATCRKAGLPPDAWRDRGSKVSAFRTVHFGGPVLAPVADTVVPSAPDAATAPSSPRSHALRPTPDPSG